MNVKMKAVSYPKYDFIPSDDKLLLNEGFCVLDQFVGFYSHLIPRCTPERFIEICSDYMNADVDDLDYGIDGIFWKIEDGVSTRCLSRVCEIFDISLYAFDVSNKCFHRHLSKNRHYPPLVYYTVNNHMYWVSDRDKAFSLTRQAREASP